jgi:cytochrome c-type biogenesis protein CcmH
VISRQYISAQHPVSKLKFLILFILVSLALSACNNAQAEVPALEQRAQALNRSIMCPVCPGESIDQSQVALAVQMRGIVNEKLAKGWSDDQIREFFVERYGHSVLLEPPTEGISLAVWLLPPIGVAAAAGVFVLVIRRMRRNPEESPMNDDDDTISDNELHAYYERIEASVSDE